MAVLDFINLSMDNDYESVLIYDMDLEKEFDSDMNEYNDYYHSEIISWNIDGNKICLNVEGL